MADNTTTLESASEISRRGDEAWRDALVVIWSADEPTRLGEVILLPPAGERRSFVFGRGDQNDGRHERARLVRQRPGKTSETSPIGSSYVSRSQLVVRSHPEGGVVVENVGKAALVIAGQATDGGRARPGDLIEIGRRFVLFCTRRPPNLPALRAGDPRLSFPFGELDAFGNAGESPEAWRLRDEIALVASRREHVLLLGESGTGKELAAQAIHLLSPRAGRRLVARNAATVPPGLIDAEFFGNAPNYPNAGMPERPGLVGEAEGSTLFLDEIGELPSELQAHLLRFLDAGEYQRLGDARRRSVDARVVAATNRPLSQLKADLAARFALRVRTPALHERREDVPIVARHLLSALVRGGDAHSARFASESGEPRISRELIVALVNRLYTTHVRELSAILFRAALESSRDVVELTKGAREDLGLSASTGPSVAHETSREELVAALDRHGGVREKVWRDLGLPNRYVLKRLLRKHGLAEN
jgi:transcriptional regulator with AAA-type ATPase domain